MKSIIQQAFEFANFHHFMVGQFRKFPEWPGDKVPYIVHPCEVAQIVRTVPDHTVDMICAALLHDVLEDTKATLDEMQKQFNDEVCRIVVALTDVPKGEGQPNRATRKAMDRERVGTKDWAVQTVKLADFMSNTKSIVAGDPRFAPQYMKEKRLALPYLTRGDATLWAIANKSVEEYFKGRYGENQAY